MRKPGPAPSFPVAASLWRERSRRCYWADAWLKWRSLDSRWHSESCSTHLSCVPYWCRRFWYLSGAVVSAHSFGLQTYRRAAKFQRDEVAKRRLRGMPAFQAEAPVRRASPRRFWSRGAVSRFRSPTVRTSGVATQAIVAHILMSYGLRFSSLVSRRTLPGANRLAYRVHSPGRLTALQTIEATHKRETFDASRLCHPELRSQNHCAALSIA
jgi:hypothetical protein